MKFSIITPSYRSGKFLSLCAASIDDQGVEFEHIIQDSESEDGSIEMLAPSPHRKVFIEKDSGMYDGVNRGLKRAEGEILAYLNCDEQYLPRALKTVEKYFKENPSIDVLFSEVIVTDEKGGYICHRPIVSPTKYHTLVSGNMASMTCATFFRKKVIQEYGLFFDKSFSAVGDGEWLARLLEKKIRSGTLREFTSTFLDNGENLGMKKKSITEQERIKQIAPFFMRRLKPLVVFKYRLKKLLRGCYSQKPFSYSVYTLDSTQARKNFSVEHPTSLWKARFKIS